ncbi:MAG TPA: Gfo/Idh/MocA family oxidoreductase [Usitatibacter sp.]|nr:Gfo/Idh/MocA family oxidoreductase [Usitatibacter sp.]
MKPVRYAVVGLGFISQLTVLPAFRNARRNSRLAALVSGDAAKRRALGKLYGVPTYSYAGYRALLESGDVDAVYIGLPNHLHREYAVRAARAGVHVLCEKPLAVTEADCAAMIAACKRARVKLMTAYRLHFEKMTLTAIAAARDGTIGEARLFDSSFSFRITGANVRLMKASEGGGPLYDIGVYCINAVRHLFGAEPIEAYATLAGGRRRGRGAEDSASCVLRFPGDRLATFQVSFDSATTGEYRVLGTKGALHAAPGYGFSERLRLTIRSGGRERSVEYPRSDHFGPQLIHFSDCIRRGREPGPSGEDGLADVRIIRALYRSAKLGRPVRLAPRRARPAPALAQRITCPPVRYLPMVNARPPR